MKKHLLSLALLALSASLHAGDLPTLRFGVEPGFAPYESKDAAGNLVGFDIDLGNAICAHLQRRCVWVVNSFDGIIPALNARKFDAILSAMNITTARQKQVDFTDKIYAPPIFLVARKGSLAGNQPDQLRGKTLGVEQGSSQEAYAQKYYRQPGISVHAYQGSQSVIQDLAAGRLDAAILAGVVADYNFLRQPQGADFAFVGPALQDPELFGAGAAIAVRKGDDTLRSQLNGAIAALIADGSYQKLAGNYFSFDIYAGGETAP